MKAIILVVFLFAQHPGNPPAPPPGCSNPVPGVQNPNCADDVPLTGLEWLALAGGYYGIKKIKEKRD